MDSIAGVILCVNREKRVCRTEDCSRFKKSLENGAAGWVLLQVRVNQPLFPARDNYNGLIGQRFAKPLCDIEWFPNHSNEGETRGGRRSRNYPM